MPILHYVMHVRFLRIITGARKKYHTTNKSCCLQPFLCSHIYTPTLDAVIAISLCYSVSRKKKNCWKPGTSTATGSWNHHHTMGRQQNPQHHGDKTWRKNQSPSQTWHHATGLGPMKWKGGQRRKRFAIFVVFLPLPYPPCWKKENCQCTLGMLWKEEELGGIETYVISFN